jgi:hypothetical protein
MASLHSRDIRIRRTLDPDATRRARAQCIEGVRATLRAEDRAKRSAALETAMGSVVCDSTAQPSHAFLAARALVEITRRLPCAEGAAGLAVETPSVSPPQIVAWARAVLAAEVAAPFVVQLHAALLVRADKLADERFSRDVAEIVRAIDLCAYMNTPRGLAALASTDELCYMIAAMATTPDLGVSSDALMCTLHRLLCREAAAAQRRAETEGAQRRTLELLVSAAQVVCEYAPLSESALVARTVLGGPRGDAGVGGPLHSLARAAQTVAIDVPEVAGIQLERVSALALLVDVAAALRLSAGGAVAAALAASAVATALPTMAAWFTEDTDVVTLNLIRVVRVLLAVVPPRVIVEHGAAHVPGSMLAAMRRRLYTRTPADDSWDDSAVADTLAILTRLLEWDHLPARELLGDSIRVALEAQDAERVAVCLSVLVRFPDHLISVARSMPPAFAAHALPRIAVYPRWSTVAATALEILRQSERPRA